MIRRAALLALLFPAVLAAQPNAVLLVAKPGMADPNFRETVVLVTQAPDASTVGVILNRPTARRHGAGDETVYEGGPVMREVLVAVFRAEREPAAAFHVLPGVYLSMHPDNIAPPARERRPHFRLYAGFAGWAPGQLQGEMTRDAWYVLPASAEVIFRADTRGLWRELVDKATNRVAVANEGSRGILVP